MYCVVVGGGKSVGLITDYINSRDTTAKNIDFCYIIYELM